MVDRTQNQENVYLLTEAGVNDLLNFVDYNGVDVQNGDIPMYEIPSSGGIKVEKSAELMEEEPAEEEETTEEKPKGNSATMFIIVVIIAGVGVGYYFLKNKKRKEDLEEAEEMDAFDVPDEVEEDETEYEEGDDADESDDTKISDEELEGEELEYFDEEDDDAVVVPEEYDEAAADAEAERARFLAYVGNKDTED